MSKLIPIEKRLDWTLEDNAKKAIEIADLKAKLEALSTLIREMDEDDWRRVDDYSIFCWRKSEDAALWKQLRELANE